MESLKALSIGLPVITMPSEYMAGRFTLAHYEVMKYRELIVHSVHDYVTLALEIAHKPKLRQQYVSDILDRVHHLFECEHVVEDWVTFVSKSIKN
jgi:protein O-GlcNAc transferase